jgi:Flp pilus assembly protein TadG
LEDKLLRDTRGSVLVETAIVLPAFLVLVLGTIDVIFMFFDWAKANKAAYVGARAAVVMNPVAPNITNLSYTQAQLQLSGQNCFDNTGTNINCPAVTKTICTSTGCNPTTYGFSSANLTAIVNVMQNVFCPEINNLNSCQLQPANVQISYETNNLGIVGQTWSGNTFEFSLPMNVTVSLTGLTHQFYFISPLLQFFGGGVAATPAIPPFATTMQSEDMFTN